MVIAIENINSTCPTALTGAALCRANAENQDAVVMAAKKPAAKPGFQSLKPAISSALR